MRQAAKIHQHLRISSDLVAQKITECALRPLLSNTRSFIEGRLFHLMGKTQQLQHQVVALARNIWGLSSGQRLLRPLRDEIRHRLKVTKEWVERGAGLENEF